MARDVRKSGTLSQQDTCAASALSYRCAGFPVCRKKPSGPGASQLQVRGEVRNCEPHLGSVADHPPRSIAVDRVGAALGTCGEQGQRESKLNGFVAARVGRPELVTRQSRPAGGGAGAPSSAALGSPNPVRVCYFHCAGHADGVCSAGGGRARQATGLSEVRPT